MNRRIVVAGIVIAIVLFSSLLLFGIIRGQMDRNVLGSEITYKNAEKYVSGGAEINDTVRSLDLHWFTGRINFRQHKGSTVRLSELSNKKTDENLQMHWWLDGETLRVQFGKSGFRVEGNLEKELTVDLPEGISFENVAIDAASADFHIPSLEAETIDLTATSAAMDANFNARRVKAGTTSGNMKFRVGKDAEEISVQCTSGNIDIEAESPDILSVQNTSGNIFVKAKKAPRCDIGSTSGNIEAQIEESENLKLRSTSGKVQASLKKIKTLKIDSTGGDILVQLPEKPGFTARISTTTGKIRYDKAIALQDDQYICGDGSGSVDISSTSGHVNVDLVS